MTSCVLNHVPPTRYSICSRQICSYLRLWHIPVECDLYLEKNVHSDIGENNVYVCFNRALILLILR